MSKYFETKDGSLEAVSTKIAKEQPTIKKQEPNVKLERKTYFENKPGSLEDAANKVVSEGYIAEAKYSINMADASYIKGSELMKAMRQAKKDGNTKKALDDLDIVIQKQPTFAVTYNIRAAVKKVMGIDYCEDLKMFCNLTQNCEEYKKKCGHESKK